MARRRQRRRRVRSQKGGTFYNGQLVVNKGINPRSWDNYLPRGYLQRGAGSKKAGNLYRGLHRVANWINKQEKKPSSYHKQKGRKWGRRLAWMI